jgi:hypothetical protein
MTRSLGGAKLQNGFDRYAFYAETTGLATRGAAKGRPCGRSEKTGKMKISLAKKGASA